MRNKERDRDPTPNASGARAQQGHKNRIVIVAVVALLVRAVYFVEYAASPLFGYFGVDDLYYFIWAGEIAAGDWLGSQIFEQGPLYAYLLAAVRLIVGDQISWMLVPQLLSGVVVAVLTYDSARRLFDAKTAIVAGLAAAVFGPLVYYECMLMKSFLTPLLTMVALNAGLRMRGDPNTGASRHPWLWPLAAGVAVGLLCLVQEYHVLLLLPIAAWMWVSGSPNETPRWKHMAQIGLLSAGAALCIVPSLARNWMVAREFVLVTAGGGEVFYIAHGPQARPYYNPPDFVSGAAGQEHEDFRLEAHRRTGQEMSSGESSRYWFREGLAAITADPLRTARLTVLKGITVFNDYDVPDSQSYAVTRRFVAALHLLPSLGWIGGLALVGMGLCVRTPSRFLLPLGMVAAHTAPILIFYNFGRFRLGMMPLWILFAAHAIVWIFGELRNTTSPRRFKALMLAATATVISASMFYPLWTNEYRLPDSIKVALLAVRVKDYSLAEDELREVVASLKQAQPESPLAVLDMAHVGHVWQMMAEICLATGRPAEGMEHLRRLWRLPAREDLREQNLKAAFMLSQRALRQERIAQAPSDFALVRAELVEVCAELRRLRPDVVAYWAVSAAHTQDLVEAADVESGLQAAWQNSDGAQTIESRAWYNAGGAFLARLRGDWRRASDLAEQALNDMPHHPLDNELRAMIGKRN